MRVRGAIVFVALMYLVLMLCAKVTRADEPLAAARNRNVDEPHAADELGDSRMVCRLHHLHSIGRKS